MMKESYQISDALGKVLTAAEHNTSKVTGHDESVTPHP
jgi:hypothetical protein